MKELSDISWLVTEEEYRADPALSYSTLAKYERGGFKELPHLFDSISTPSLTLGSAVDAIITGGEKEFNERFFVAEFPSVSDSILPIVKALFNEFYITHSELTAIPDIEVIGFASKYNYQNNWKPETRAKVIKEKGADYYKLLYLAGSKTILDTNTYNKVIAMVNALKTSEATKFYFAEDNPFDDIKRYYQLKFKATFDEVDYRNMADLIVVNYKDKWVMPTDLKTTGHFEYEFFGSFAQWRYDVQSRLYWRIIRDNMDKDPYFKDFELLDYRFIVVNKESLNPLVWNFEDTQKKGTLYYGTQNQIIMRDPFEIGKELSEYLNSTPIVPKGIELSSNNSITEWLNKN